MAWRIHHVAYVENLNPLRQSYFSTPRIRPRLPSWIKSRNDKRRPRYFLAIDTTRRRFALISFSLAFMSPFSYFLASSTSCSKERRGVLPISFKYFLIGSSDSPC